MLIRPTIKQGLKSKSNSVLLTYAQNIASMMTGNSSYTTPNPTLIALGTLISDFSDALTAWGDIHNRGSHVQHNAVVTTRDALMDGLTALSNYCETTTPYDADAFASGGWDVKNAASPIGPLPAPANLRAMPRGITVPLNQNKIRWDKVKGAGSYNVRRGLTADYNASVVIATVTAARFIDETPGMDLTFYWVVPVGANGPGVHSDVLQAFCHINS